MKFSGLRKVVLFLCAPLVVLSFFGCTALNDSDKGGALSVTMPSARYTVSDVAYYTVSVFRIIQKQADGEDFQEEHRYYIACDERVNPGKTFSVDRVEPAVWTVEVNAWLDSDKLAGGGTSEVKVESGKTARATVVISLYKDINAEVAFSPVLSISDMTISDTAATVTLSNYTVTDNTSVIWSLNGNEITDDFAAIIWGINSDGTAVFSVTDAIETTIIKLGTNTLSVMIYENDILAGSAVTTFELTSPSVVTPRLSVPDMTPDESSVTVKISNYTVSGSTNIKWYLNGTYVDKDTYGFIYGINNDGTANFEVQTAYDSGILVPGENTLKAEIYEYETLVTTVSDSFTYSV